MKNLALSVFLLFCANLFFGQSVDSIELLRIDFEDKISTINDKLEEIQQQNKSIEAENNQFKRIFYVQDSIAYSTSFNNLAFALENGDVLEKDFETAINDITKDPILVKLMEANNPNSDVLGFKFKEVILEASKNSFTKGLREKNEVVRWTNIVDKVINNDVVKSILQTNPITNVVSSIVSLAANFSTTTQVGKKVIETRDAFQQEQINEFISEMKPYIEFYDRLLLTGNLYLLEVDRIKEKYSYLNQSANEFNQNLLKTLDFKISPRKSLNVQLQELYKYEYDKNGQEKFGEVLKRKRIVAATEHIADFHVLKEDVNDLQKEYNIALIRFLDNYSTHLSEAKEFKKDMDQKKVNALLKDIERLKQRLRDQSQQASN